MPFYAIILRAPPITSYVNECTSPSSQTAAYVSKATGPTDPTPPDVCVFRAVHFVTTQVRTLLNDPRTTTT